MNQIIKSNSSSASTRTNVNQEERKRSIFRKLDNAQFGRSHWTAMLVAGSGFFVDSYDNFIIGLIVPMLAYGYFNKSALDSASDGWLKAASSWGNLFGQFGFSIMGDVFGRKKMYGIELIILIIGAIGCAVASWPLGDGFSIVASLALWRFVLGVGIGGDYPVSAVITSEFASTKRRGTMIAAVFAMQGMGILVGSIVAITTLASFKQQIIDDPKTLNICWRILAGFGALPACFAVYWRLTIPETPRFAIDVLHDTDRGENATDVFLKGDGIAEVRMADDTTKSKYSTFGAYRVAFSNHFSKWVNLKVLIGCALTWFFVDIGYYGTSLNTSVVLQFIGYGSPKIVGPPTGQDVFNDVWARACGTALINIGSTVPGYFFTVALVDKWGRKPIQYMGFIMLTLIFLFMAIFYQQLTAKSGNGSIGGENIVFIVMYSAAQFFFNFGPNATTFIIPAEAFPTAVRSTGHGISAGTGKLGAILAAQCFSLLTKSSIGLQGVLYIFAASCAIGLYFTSWVPETMGLSLEDLDRDAVMEDKVKHDSQII